VVGTITTQSSTTVAKDLIISQTPAAGASVAPGSAVALVVPSGPPPVTVPDVTNITQAAATTILNGANLAVGTVTTQSSTTVAKDLIISQTPVAGASVAPGSAVALVISSGPPPVTVPDVTNKTQAAATTILNASNLVVGTITTQSSTTVAKDLIISQTPAAGASVAPGSAVALVISSGPPPVTVPDVTNITQAAATTILNAANLIVGTVTTQSSTTV